MKDFFILKLLDKIKFVFTFLGANYNIMRSILQVKLTMDERRVPTILNDHYEKEGNYFLKSLVIYGLLGLILLMFFVPPFPLFFRMNIINGMILFMIISSLISDFSSVLLDINEKNILLPRPVDHKTLSVAKTVHILIYLATISLVLGGPVLIFGTFRYGITFFAIFMVQLLFVLGFAIFLTSLLYFLVLKFFNGEKLKDIINYFQIIFTVALAISYQFIGRVFEIVDVGAIYIPKWWNYLIPPVWYSAPYAYFIEGNRELSYIYLTFVGIVVSAVLLTLYIKKIAPYFEGSLAKLNNADGASDKSQGIKKVSLREKLAKIICSNKEERAFYLFTLRMISGERKIKLKLLPSLAFGVIFPLIFIFNAYTVFTTYQEFIEGTTQTNNYLLWLYISVSMFVTTLPILNTSEKTKGAWVYLALPVKHRSNIHKGAIKALLFNYYIPPFLIVCAAYIAIFGTSIILGLMVILLNLILTVIIISKMISEDLPFSQSFMSIKDKSIAIFFSSVGLCGGGAFVHYAAAKFPNGVLVLAGLFVVAIPIAWKIVYNEKNFA